MEKYLNNELAEPPPLNPHQCRFGQWLDKEGRERYGATEHFPDIEELHLQVHQVAVELCRLRTDGRSEEISQRREELRRLRDALFARLQPLCALDR